MLWGMEEVAQGRDGVGGQWHSQRQLAPQRLHLQEQHLVSRKQVQGREQGRGQQGQPHLMLQPPLSQQQGPVTWHQAGTAAPRAWGRPLPLLLLLMLPRVLQQAEVRVQWARSRQDSTSQVQELLQRPLQLQSQQEQGLLQQKQQKQHQQLGRKLVSSWLPCVASCTWRGHSAPTQNGSGSSLWASLPCSGHTRWALAALSGSYCRL